MTRLLPLLLALAAVPAAAQVQFGVRAGAGVATLEVHDESFPARVDSDDRLSLTGGVTAELPLSDALALRTELVYTMKGGHREASIEETLGGNALDVTFDYDYAFDYVELPVLLEVAEATSVARLAVFAGPTLAFNVREKVDAQVTGTVNGAPITDEQAAMLLGPPPDQWVETLDVGAALGTRAVRGRLAFEARFTLGLPVVSAEDEDAGTVFVGVKNRAFAVSVGYTL
ncbi:MAG TPA: porin family protein [Rubricoccaceae bacterium]|nr:porin family protein [Rubricoccaceae bacterium]